MRKASRSSEQPQNISKAADTRLGTRGSVVAIGPYAPPRQGSIMDNSIPPVFLIQQKSHFAIYSGWAISKRASYYRLMMRGHLVFFLEGSRYGACRYTAANKERGHK